MKVSVIYKVVDGTDLDADVYLPHVEEARSQHGSPVGNLRHGTCVEDGID